MLLDWIEKGCAIFMKNKKYFNYKDNVTLYDEFVCSEFSWLPINKQKENAKRLEEMTREDDEY